MDGARKFMRLGHYRHPSQRQASTGLEFTKVFQFYHIFFVLIFKENSSPYLFNWAEPCDN